MSETNRFLLTAQEPSTALLEMFRFCFLKNTTRLARTGYFFHAEEMAALWVNTPELLRWVKL